MVKIFEGVEPDPAYLVWAYSSQCGKAELGQETDISSDVAAGFCGTATLGQVRIVTEITYI